MKKLGIVTVVAVLAALLWVLPAVAKTSLTQAELDQITASGQPAVVIAGDAQWRATGSHLGLRFDPDTTNGNTVTWIPDTTVNFAPGTSAQNNLRALVVNNVIGDNSVATGINIMSTDRGPAGNQTNTITQSWGATLDVGAAVGPAGKAADCSDSVNQFNTCTGGTAGTVRLLSAYGDQILLGGVVRNFSDTTYNVAFGPAFQENLAALAVNNVVGFNMVASAINIISSTVALPSGTTLVFSPAITGPLGNQTNTINQFRGTPFSRPSTTP